MCVCYVCVREKERDQLKVRDVVHFRYVKIKVIFFPQLVQQYSRRMTLMRDVVDE